MIYLSPRGNGSDYCAGVRAFQAARPPPAEWFVTLNQFLFWFFLAVALVCTAVWWRLREEPRLAQRSFTVTVANTMGATMCFAAIAGRNSWWWWMEVAPSVYVMMPGMPCHLLAYLYLSMLVMVAAPSQLALAVMLNRARFARAVGHLNLLQLEAARRENEHSSSEGAGGGDGTTRRMRRRGGRSLVSEWARTAVSLRAILGVFVFGTLADLDAKDVGNDEEPRTSAHHPNKTSTALASSAVVPAGNERSSGMTEEDVERLTNNNNNNAPTPTGSPARKRETGANAGEGNGRSLYGRSGMDSEGHLSVRSMGSGEVAGAGGGGEASEASARDEARLVFLLRDAMKARTMVMMLMVFYLPVVICIIPVYLTADVYRGNCVGCELSWEVFATAVVVGSIYTPTALRALYVLRKEADPAGVLFELHLSFVFTYLLAALGWFLLIADPNGVDYHRTFSWEWLVMLGFFFLWFFNSPMQIGIVLWERRARLASASSSSSNAHSHARSVTSSRVGDAGEELANNNNNAKKRSSKRLRRMDTANVSSLDAIKESLKNEALLERFLKFAETQYVVESVRFFKDVERWKRAYYEKGEDWRRTRARLIIRTYISQGAVMQVNLSGPVREEIEARYEKPTAMASKQGLETGMTIELFDRAVDEVMATLRFTLWTKFVKAGRLKTLANGVVVLREGEA